MNNLIRIQNCNSWLVSADKDLKAKLHRSLRVREKGYYHSKAYKMGQWDGYREFFKEQTGQFATGLLPEVLAALKTLKQEYKIEDQREKADWLRSYIDEEFLNLWLPPELDDKIYLHDYQVDLVNQALKRSRGIIKAPTAAGKTYIMVFLLKCLPPKTPVLFMTKNKNLVNQNYEEMKLWGVQNIGRFYGKYKEPNYITCATVHKDTLNSLGNLLPKFKVLIVDEVHECMSKVPVSAYRKMKKAYIRLGISATPFKFGGKDKVHKYTVKSFFGPVFKTKTTDSGFLTTAALQDRGILSPSHCTFYPVTKPPLPYEPYQDAVTLGIAQNFEFLKMIRDLARSRKGRTLILVERIEQGEHLKQLIPEAHWIQGKDKLEERVKVINDLKSGKNVIAIVMRQLITAGINVMLHNLINASGGDAEHNVIQQMGRGLRSASDKEKLEFFDFEFQINDYLLKHSKNRCKVLRNEGHEVIVKEEIDF